MKVLRTILVSALCILTFVALDDRDTLGLLLRKLSDYNATYPEEKVYLHVDKPFYMPGDDIWFSLYGIHGVTHQPSQISNVAYVQLVDPKGTVISTADVFVEDGTGFGDFKLLETASGGLYKLRALTKWSTNFPSQAIFEKEIQVQRVITPRMLLKLEWEREAYGPGEKATANLSVRNLKDEKASGASISYTVMTRGLIVGYDIAQTDTEGKAQISVNLASDLTTSDCILSVIVRHEGVEESISRSIPVVLNKISLEFFPEGGDLVDGLESRVAFKALNEFGKAADVQGDILSEGRIVASFSSYHMGMGAFTFIPEKGKKYHAVIRQPRVAAEFPLPTQRRNDFVLNVRRQSNEEIQVDITSALNNARTAFLIATNHGRAVYSSKLSLTPGPNAVAIDLKNDKLLSGIVVLTLFDERGHGIGERLVFVRRDNVLNIAVTTDKKSYAPGEKVKVELKATDRDGQPVQARLSLAAVDDQLLTFANDKQDNILSWFLLSSEVRGKIEKPAFYFDKNESKSSEALDFLLMTQGWRRFDWKEIGQPIQITRAPEKLGTISGFTELNRSGLRTVGEVTLIELGKARRTVRLGTRADGSFDFVNVDPTIPSLLIARKPYTIQLANVRDSVKIRRQQTFTSPSDVPRLKGRVAEFQVHQPAVDQSVRVEAGDPIDVSAAMSADLQHLDEVVVTGYGIETRRSLTGSVVTVQDQLALGTGIEAALQGRVAGVAIHQQRSEPGHTDAITLRGISTLADGSSEPLWVVDGMPLSNPQLRGFRNSTLWAPDQINSVEVLRTPEASALYGSRASNGVIVVTTNNWPHQVRYRYWKKASRYNHLIVPPRSFTTTRQFYQEQDSKGKEQGSRSNFSSTIYWNQHVVTDKNGTANVSFFNNDNTSVFRITAEGLGSNGLIGHEEVTYSTVLPLSLDVKIPEFVGLADTVRIPVRITNNTSEPRSAALIVDAPTGLTILPSDTINAKLPAETSSTVFVTLVPTGVAGNFPINIRMNGDAITNTIQVHPVGFPVRRQWSSADRSSRLSVNIHDVEKGTLNGSFQAFPNLLGNLFADSESLLREPHGCFEQVSSTTFPNILVLQYLRRVKKSDSKVESRALRFIQQGYDQLKSFEIRGGGFEWFGEPAAHEALSAYGLLEFHQMQKVYDLVDPKLIDRTSNWLMKRRDGMGGFKQNTGKYGFSAAPREVNNAYIMYALAVTGRGNVELEFNHALNEARQSNDMYRKALVANAAWHLGKQAAYRTLIDEFKEFVAKHQLDEVRAATSLTYSYGQSLKNETIAYWAQALAKEGLANFAELDKCIKYLLSHKAWPGFGSTQATTVCLQALCDFTEIASTRVQAAEISIAVNDKIADRLTFSESEVEPVGMTAFMNAISDNGDQSIDVLFSSNDGLPWQMEINWYSERPDDCNYTSLDIHTKLPSTVQMNQTARLTVDVNNNSNLGLPMTMAVIGIPAGLSVQPWQLKELQEKRVFDFYEINGDRLALYFREVAPSASMQINLDLKAEMPGSFKGAASCTYLYYNSECKKWSEGMAIIVR